MIFSSRKENLYFILSGFFITNAIVAELISSKLITIGPFTTIVGILPWPIVFLATDIINEYFGKKAVQKLSVVTACLIAYAFLILSVAISVPASSLSQVSNMEFKKVFGQSQWVIIGSITAFLVSQILDVYVFWFIRKVTGDKMIWLRATGSTAVSQLIDSFIVLAIGFLLPGYIAFDSFFEIGFTNYLFKLIIAIGLTPLVYLAHGFINKYLGKESESVLSNSAAESLNEKI